MNEYINRAEIKGRVGSVRIFDTGSGKVAKLSVATEKLFKDRDGAVTIQTTWHCVQAWNKRGIPDIETIKNGAFVHVEGAMRQAKYATADGYTSSYSEILADRLEILN